MEASLTPRTSASWPEWTDTAWGPWQTHWLNWDCCQVFKLFSFCFSFSTSQRWGLRRRGTTARRGCLLTQIWRRTFGAPAGSTSVETPSRTPNPWGRGTASTTARCRTSPDASRWRWRTSWRAGGGGSPCSKWRSTGLRKTCCPPPCPRTPWAATTPRRSGGW